MGKAMEVTCYRIEAAALRRVRRLIGKQPRPKGGGPYRTLSDLVRGFVLGLTPAQVARLCSR